jgi:monoamine oxidase
MKRLRALRAGDLALAQALQWCCEGDDLMTARAELLGYVEGFHAADPGELSTRWFIEVEQNQPADASGLRSLDGTAQIPQLIRKDVTARIELDTIVRRVRWGKGRVAVEVETNGRSRTVEGEALLVTLPLSILQLEPPHSSAVIFDPPLTMRSPALALMSMGKATKIAIRFATAFWKSAGPLRDMLFLHAFDQPFPTWWTMEPVQVPLLTGWAGGLQSVRLGTNDGERLRSLALTSLAHALGISREAVDEQVVSCHLHQWNQDPFALGAYTYVRVGGQDAHRALAQPIENTLFFAGEATVGRGLNATMEGAIESGQRAGDEISHVAATGSGRRFTKQ